MSTIHYTDPQYPQSLLSYEKRPETIYYLGDVSLFNSRCVAIIGTRHPTPHGELVTRNIAYHLAKHGGYTIVSGLAAGCDTAAHRGALDAGGRTIAILGTSLSDIYPKQNRPLADRIIASGGLVYTEYEKPAYQPRRFFERDHLQAAQSLAVIPVQAGIGSGTLHTVNSAIEQSRMLLIPMPGKSSFATHPEKYAGLLPYIREKRCITFRGSCDYPLVLEHLASLS